MAHQRLLCLISFPQCPRQSQIRALKSLPLDQGINLRIVEREDFTDCMMNCVPQPLLFFTNGRLHPLRSHYSILGLDADTIKYGG